VSRSSLVVAALAASVLSSAASAASLPVTTIIIDTDHGPAKFKVEVAGDEPSQRLGLMYRKSMAPDAGMLFDFHASQIETFWMKNTVLPLDLIFIRANGSISSIAPSAVPYSESPIPSSEPVRAVLEINGGRAAALGIEPDQHVHNGIFGNALPGQK
jgi:uncharacterized membrane protein (UPF0127 family)